MCKGKKKKKGRACTRKRKKMKKKQEEEEREKEGGRNGRCCKEEEMVKIGNKGTYSRFKGRQVFNWEHECRVWFCLACLR